MGIVDDIQKDRRTKNILAQTNTKTVSVPPASTGLVGDQQPAEVFTVSDFDLVKNQVHLEEKNFQLMEALNTMGQITNMQSQSGPIPGTAAITNATSASGSTFTVFQPNSGEVHALTGAIIADIGGGSAVNLYLYDGTNVVTVARETAAGVFDPVGIPPVYVTNDVYLAAQGSGITGTLSINVSTIRVR